MSIAAISSVSIPQIQQLPLTAVHNAPGAVDFGQILKSTINQVEQSNQQAETLVSKFLAGEDNEIHNTVIATQKADLQFDLFMQVRNKMVSAYSEIMKMQL
jgi:flagellar hook-basal body complex protein FliE